MKRVTNLTVRSYHDSKLRYLGEKRVLAQWLHSRSKSQNSLVFATRAYRTLVLLDDVFGYCHRPRCIASHHQRPETPYIHVSTDASAECTNVECNAVKKHRRHSRGICLFIDAKEMGIVGKSHPNVAFNF
jgi:hypothetical protein